MISERTNIDRAQSGEVALTAYWVNTHAGGEASLPYMEGDEQTNLQDLITDLRHYAKIKDCDFEMAVENSFGHFEAEVEDEENPTDG